MSSRILTSLKEAAVSRYFGCTVNIKIDPANSRRVVCISEPAEAVDKAVEILIGDHSLPCRQIVDILTDLHQEAKVCLYRHQQAAKANK